MLELRIAGRSFGKPVLGEVFATIERGDHICLLGPSGIGKTTLLNAIAGLDKALPSDAIVGCDITQQADAGDSKCSHWCDSGHRYCDVSVGCYRDI